MRLWFTIALALGIATTCAAQLCKFPDLQPHKPSQNPPGPGLAPATVGKPYLQTVTSDVPVTWVGAVTNAADGSLITMPIMPPPGISAQPSGQSLTLSGTPTQVGSSELPISGINTGSDRSQCASTTNYPFVVNPAPSTLTITTPSLPAGTVGQPYSAIVMATGGTLPYSWSSTSLPPGLMITGNPDGTATISGTPTQAGTNQSVGVSVTDSGNPKTGASKGYSLTINAASQSQFTITTQSLPIGTIGQSYSAPLAQTGGVGTVTWQLLSGQLPGGLLVNPNGAIFGTATQSGSFPITIRATDSTGKTADMQFTLSVFSGFHITTTGLVMGTVGQPYTYTLAALGGTMPYGWMVSGLPAGMTYSATTGVISGTPTASGTSSITVTAHDSGSLSDAQTFSLTINPAQGSPLSLGPTSLPSGQVGTSYSQMVKATGGSGTYNYSVISGNLPDGVTFLPATAVLSGGPTKAGTFTFTIQAQDVISGMTVSMTYTVTITATAPSSNITLMPATLPTVPVNRPFSIGITALGGASPYTITILGPSPFDPTRPVTPPWVNLTPMPPDMAWITGTPPVTGNFPVNIQITDNQQSTVTKLYMLNVVVNAPTVPPTISIDNIPFSGTFGDPISSATGELFGFDERPDLSLGGPLPLGFRRYYASSLSGSGVASALGTNWMHNFDIGMSVSGSTATVTLFRGKTVTFTRSGTDWQLSSTELRPYQLAASGTGFQFSSPAANLIYTFDSTGTLTAIADRNGNTLTVTQAAGGLGPSQVSDGLGRTLTFTYAAKNLTRVQDQSGRAVVFEYSSGLLSAWTDANGKRATFAYAAGNTRGLITAETLPAGNRPLSQQFDSQGRVSSVSDSSSTTLSTIAYSANGATVTHPAGMTFTQGHDAQHNLTSETDPSGGASQYTYDAAGHPTSVTDRTGVKSTATWDPASGLPASYTDPSGAVTSFTYTPDTQGGLTFYDLTAVHFGDGTSASIARDVKGNPISLTDQAGQVWKATWNARGQIATATNPSGGVTTYTYGTDATLTSIQLPSGDTTKLAYDVVSRPSQVTEADGATQSFQYDAVDNLLRATDERAGVSAASYDDNENPRSFTDALSAVTSIAFDTDNRVSSVTDALGAATKRVYDAVSRLKSVTNAAGNSITYSYDSLNRVTSAVDAAGKGFSFGWDQEARLTSLTDPLGRVASFTRDARGLVTAATTPNNEKFATTYDALGRRTSTIDPLGRAAQFRYDARGLLVGVTLPASIAASYTRNELGLITSVLDPNGNAWPSAYDKLGRQISGADPLGQTTTIAYDSRQRPSLLTLPQGSVQPGYDPSGNLLALNYSDGTKFSYTYDADNRLTGANGVTLAYDANGRITSSNGLAIARDAAGRIVSITYAPGKAVQYTYDIRGLLTIVSDWAGGGASFTYDDAGQLTAIAYSNGAQESRTYDLDGRVSTINVTAAGANLSSITLTRDAAGQVTGANRSAPNLPSPPAGAQAFSFDAASQNAAATYDPLGRVASDPIRAYTWDLASRLLGYSGSDGAASFTYDAFGQRISRASGGATQTHVLNFALSLPSVSVVRSDSGDQRYYVWLPSGALLYSLEAADNSRHFYHFDESGSTIALTDDTGAVTDTYAITPYGESAVQTGATDNPFTFQGALGVMQEGSTGLYYMRARYYDSASARFLSRDPAPALDPRELSPYQYALDNPLGFTDPAGLDQQPIAQTSLTCSVNVAATPQLRAEGYTQSTGDITIHCTEGPTCAVGTGWCSSIDITKLLEAVGSVGGRLNGSVTPDALLSIDEPDKSPQALPFQQPSPAPITTTPLPSLISGPFGQSPLPIPLFTNPSGGNSAASVSICQTNLLYSFVTNQAGFDTGLEIANTATDLSGNPPQPGSCTLSFYGGPPPFLSFPSPVPVCNYGYGPFFLHLPPPDFWRARLDGPMNTGR